MVVEEVKPVAVDYSVIGLPVITVIVIHLITKCLVWDEEKVVVVEKHAARG